MINFINDRELARRFRDNKVSELEQFLYLLLTLFLWYFFTSNFIIYADLTQEDLIYYQSDITMYFDLIFIAIFVVGTSKAAFVNAAGDNRNFVARYISIGFPITIQMVLLMVISYLPLMLLTESRNIEGVGIVIAMAYYYLRLISSIKVASGQKD